MFVSKEIEEFFKETTDPQDAIFKTAKKYLNEEMKLLALSLAETDIFRQAKRDSIFLVKNKDYFDFKNTIDMDKRILKFLMKHGKRRFWMWIKFHEYLNDLDVQDLDTINYWYRKVMNNSPVYKVDQLKITKQDLLDVGHHPDTLWKKLEYLLVAVMNKTVKNDKQKMLEYLELKRKQGKGPY